MAAPQEHDPARLLEASWLASDILFEDPYSTSITPLEALLMRAVSQLLPDHTSFYPSEVAAVIGMNPGNASRHLLKFKREYGILDTHLDPAGGSSGGRPRHMYAPTELGALVFEVFETEEQQRADLLN